MPTAMSNKHARVTIEDNNGASTRVELGPGPGDFQCSEIVAGQCEELPIMDRESFVELIDGTQIFPTFSLSIFLNGSNADSTERKAINAVLGQGPYATDAAAPSPAPAGVTTDPGGTVWCTKIRWTATRKGIIAGWELSNCRIKVSFNEAKDGCKYSFSGTCYGSITPI